MSSQASTSDETPLRFHRKCYQNMRVTHDGSIARRTNTNFFTRGLVFGTRPVQKNERITFKLMELAENLGGFVYVGFTSRDPENMRGVTCQHLAKESGYWSWFFPKDLCSQNRPLFYYLSDEGRVHYGIDDVEKGLFQGMVQLSQPLYPLFDIFGNSSGIRLIDAPSTSANARPKSNKKVMPLMLHSTHSKNIRTNKNVAHRVDARYSQGYVFTERPIKPTEVISIQISPNHQGMLFGGIVHLGVTSCDPAHLSREDLPDNVNLLVDRPEYWVLICDFAKLKCGDEISLSINKKGQIDFCLNGGKFKGVVHVDASLKLWVFVNVYGTTEAIHLLTCPEQTKVEEKECVVCYDNVIEATLYRCGHTCMCFECAVEQWQGKGDGHCPLCRAVIRDVIRIHK